FYFQTANAPPALLFAARAAPSLWSPPRKKSRGVERREASNKVHATQASGRSLRHRPALRAWRARAKRARLTALHLRLSADARGGRSASAPGRASWDEGCFTQSQSS